MAAPLVNQYVPRQRRFNHAATRPVPPDSPIELLVPSRFAGRSFVLVSVLAFVLAMAAETGVPFCLTVCSQGHIRAARRPYHAQTALNLSFEPL